MLSFKKTNEPILRKLTDRWKDGWTLFYRTLRAEVGGSTKEIPKKPGSNKKLTVKLMKKITYFYPESIVYPFASVYEKKWKLYHCKHWFLWNTNLSRMFWNVSIINILCLLLLLFDKLIYLVQLLELLLSFFLLLLVLVILSCLC